MINCNNVKIRLYRYRDIEECDRLLIVGTTLATYSAFRWVTQLSQCSILGILCRLFKHAVELCKPILILNVGPTGADSHLNRPEYKSLIEKVDWKSGEVLKAVALLLT